MFVWLSFRQTHAAVIEGCEAAWAFFGGIFKVLIPDNRTPVVTNADPVNPTFTVGWLDTLRPAASAQTRRGCAHRRTSHVSSGSCSTCAETSSLARTSPI